MAVQLLVLPKMEDSMTDSNFAALQQLHSSLRVAIYCRLSKDDNLDGESVSIQNQWDMLETWCQERRLTVVGVYAEIPCFLFGRFENLRQPAERVVTFGSRLQMLEKKRFL